MPASRSRRSVRTAASGLLIAVGLLGTGGVTLASLKLTDEHMRAANVAADLRNNLGELIGVSYDLTGPSTAAPASASARRYEADVRTEVSDLQASGFQSHTVAAAKAAVLAFLAGVEQEEALAHPATSQTLLPLAKRNLGLATSAMATVTGVLSAERHDAHQAATAAAAEILATGGALLTLLGVGFWWEGRRRRRSEREQAEKQARARFEAMVEHGSDIVVVTGDGGLVRYASPSVRSRLGMKLEGANRDRLELGVHPADRHLPAQMMAEATETGRSGPVEIRVRGLVDEWVTLNFSVVDLREVPVVAGLVWTGRDVTEQVAAREALADSEAGFRLLFEQNPHPMWVYDLETLAFMEVNEAAVERYGYSRDQFLTMEIHDIRPVEDRGDLSEHLREGRPDFQRSGVWRHRTANGEVIDVDVVSHSLVLGGRPCALVLSQDVTARLAAERELAFQAVHDPLTGLPNRTLLVDRLEQALARARRADREVGVIFIDLDRFKVINDGLGHAGGDRLLIEVASRLESTARGSDTVARLSGDEFVVVLDSITDPAEAEAAARRIAWALDSPFTIDRTELYVSASQGIAVAQPGESADEVLSKADAAMYWAKERGGARAEFADEKVVTRAATRLALESDLRRAVESDEFVLHYQPIVSLATREIVGAEALVRWEHPDHGLLAPDEFIPAAEETGLVVPLGEWVLRQALADASRWPNLTVAVNISGRQLASSNFVFGVARALSSAEFDPRLLHLEVTESVLLEDIDRSVAVLDALKQLGLRVDVDDFGTGYSSLAYVQRLPIDTLKVDKSFVDRLDGDHPDGSIIRTIVELAQSLGVSVIAEGVETDRQLNRLSELGCSLAQGYFLARPMALSHFEELLDRQAKSPVAAGF